MCGIFALFALFGYLRDCYNIIAVKQKKGY